MTNSRCTVRSTGRKATILTGLIAAGACLTTFAHGGEPCTPGWDDTFGVPGVNVLGSVRAFTIFEDDLIAGGNFHTIGGVEAANVARWDGDAWHPLGDGVNDLVNAMAVYDGDIYAGTDVGLTRWDGSSWTAVPGEMLNNPNVNALAVFDGELYAGGNFDMIGTLQVNQIARWNGSTWSPLGSGINNGYPVNGLTVYNDFLVVVGTFPQIGCQQVERVARWSGGGWHAFGSDCEDMACHKPDNPDCGISASPETTIVHDGQLIVAGTFAVASNTYVRSITRWSESAQAWLGYNELCPNPDFSIFTCGVGGSLPREIKALTSYDGRLIAGGNFDLIGGVEVSNIASGDGVDWEPLGSGVGGGGALTGSVTALIEYDGMLIVGGSFTTAGGHESNRIAAWHACTDTEPILGDLNDDGVVGVADLLILLGAWGPCDGPDDCPADLDDDGTAGVSDLLILLGNWG